MNRYLLFAGDNQYPQGGWGDFIGAYISKEEAREKCSRKYDWAQTIDIETLQEVDWFEPWTLPR